MNVSPKHKQFAVRAAGVMAAAVLVASVAGCGKSDGPVADTITSATGGPVTEPSTATATATTVTATASSTASDSNSGSTVPAGSSVSASTAIATIPTSMPPELDGEVGELEIIGTPLPVLPRVSIEADPARGMMAPVIIGTTFTGEEIRVDAVKSGRPTLIYFFAHWCPHCNNEIPVLNELRDSNAFRPDLDIYAVSTDPNPKSPNYPPSEWIKRMDWTYPTIIDGVANGNRAFLGKQSFGVSGFPFAVLINADGTVAARWAAEASGPQTISNIDTYLAY